MLDIVSIGDVTEDVFVHVDDLQLIRRRKNHDCLLCMKYSDKIAAQRVDKLIGGNAGNVAIGSRRLGLNSALYAQVGNDIQGKCLLNSLKKDKVSTKFFTLAKNELTNYSVVLNYGAERSILVHHEKRKYKFKDYGKTKWAYLTSMGDGSQPFYDFILKNKKKYGTKLGFNPGTHQIKWGRAKMSKLLACCEVVSINVEEAQTIFKTSSSDVRFLLKKLYGSGCKIALITDGPAGSYVYDGQTFYFCPIYDVPILERTGCGDSYTTGFIVGLIQGKEILEAMRWGTVNAASVISHIGPQEGLITIDMLKKVLKANPKFKGRTFDVPRVTSGNKYKPLKYTKF